MATIDTSRGLYPFMENMAGIPVITPKILSSKYNEVRSKVEKEFGCSSEYIIGRGLNSAVIQRLELNVTRHKGRRISISELSEIARRRIFD